MIVDCIHNPRQTRRDGDLEKWTCHNWEETKEGGEN